MDVDVPPNPFNILYGKDYSNPFYMLSDIYIPSNMISAMQYAEFLYYLNGTYRQATNKTMRYFITELEIEGEADSKESKDAKDFLIEELKILEILGIIGNDLGCYGNAFRYVYTPFDRFLVDPEKSVEYSVDLFGPKVKVSLEDGQLFYHVTAPDSKKPMKMKFVDRKSTDKNRLRVGVLDPKTVVIIHNLLTGDNTYVWRFPNAMRQAVLNGDADTTNKMPQSMLKALLGNLEYKFNLGELFHVKTPTIAGIYSGGWGMPDVIANLRDMHQVQVYRRIDEAIGLDYLIPLRLLTPTDTTTGNDPTNLINLARWKTILRSVVEIHRKDPAAWHAVPFAVKYQVCGGDAKALSPKDLHQFAQDNLLNAQGYSPELFRGNMNIQVLPTMLRLLESNWSHVPRGYNDALKFIVGKILPYLGIEELRVKLASVKHADNVERSAFYMQMFGAGEMSRQTTWKSFGVDDPIGEHERRIKEDARIAQKQREEQERQEKEQMGLVSPDGGAPSGGGGSTPMDVQSQSIQIAQELVSMPAEARRPKLLALGKSNPTLHALVTEQLEKQRGAIGQAALQQTAGVQPQ